jgi:hypothetical protein
MARNLSLFHLKETKELAEVVYQPVHGHVIFLIQFLTVPSEMVDIFDICHIGTMQQILNKEQTQKSTMVGIWQRLGHCHVQSTTIATSTPIYTATGDSSV